MRPESARSGLKVRQPVELKDEQGQMIPMAGERFGPYEILGTLGRGGVGEVYRAWDNRLEREVAIKLLHDEYPQSGNRERFRLEARAASALSHPNICTVFDMGEKDGAPYLVMELLKGETLKHRIERGGMTAEEIAQYGTEIADALGAAHETGIVHRDVKPANIMLVRQPDGRARVKVLDFGLAKITGPLGGRLAHPQDHLTVPGEAVGTVSYMSPEQARGDELDGRSDLFSLGTVLYEMATRRTPFQGSTTPLLFVKLLNEDPEPIRDWNEDVPRALEKVIFKLLEKEPGRRYQSAADAAAALHSFAGKSSGSRWRRAAPPAVPLVRVEEPVARAGLPIRPELRRESSHRPLREGQTPVPPVRRGSTEEPIRPVHIPFASERADSGARLSGGAAGTPHRRTSAGVAVHVPTPDVVGMASAMVSDVQDSSPSKVSVAGPAPVPTIPRENEPLPDMRAHFVAQEPGMAEPTVLEKAEPEDVGRTGREGAVQEISSAEADAAVETPHETILHEPENSATLTPWSVAAAQDEFSAAFESGSHPPHRDEAEYRESTLEPLAESTLPMAAALGPEFESEAMVEGAPDLEPSAVELYSQAELGVLEATAEGAPAYGDGTAVPLAIKLNPADFYEHHRVGSPADAVEVENEPGEPEPLRPVVPVAVEEEFWSEEPETSQAELRSALAKIRADERSRAIRRRLTWSGIAAAILCVVGAGCLEYELRPKKPLLAPGERLAIAAIENHTGAQMLDGSVAAGLQFSLDQTPGITLQSGASYAGAVHAINPDGRPITLTVARQAAVSAGAAAYLYGEVAELDGIVHGSGAGYRVSAVVRSTADDHELVHAEATATRFEEVPGAVDKLALALGQALEATRQAAGYVPLAREATGSLNALHLYAAGTQAQADGRIEAALKAYSAAASTDPNFVQAQLQVSWLAREEHAARSSAEAAERASAAAAGRSARTVLLAQAAAEANNRHDLNAASATARRLVEANSRDENATVLLARLDRLQNRFTDALSAAQMGLTFSPRSQALYTEAELALMALNRAPEAAALAQKASVEGLPQPSFGILTAYLAGNDAEGASASSNSHVELGVLTSRSVLLDNTGDLADATQDWMQAADAVRGQSALGGAADALLARAALNRALAGDCTQALSLAQAVQAADAHDADTAVRTGVAAGLCGDGALAESVEAVLANGLAPGIDLPEVRTALAVGRGDAGLALQEAQALIGSDPILLAPYLRSQAHLIAAQPGAAVADLEEILAHRGEVVSAGTNLYPVAQLALARAFSGSGDHANSAQAYQGFLALWDGAGSADPLRTEATQAERGIFPHPAVYMAHAEPLPAMHGTEMGSGSPVEAAALQPRTVRTRSETTETNGARASAVRVNSLSAPRTGRVESAGRVASRPVHNARPPLRTDLPPSWFAAPVRTVSTGQGSAPAVPQHSVSESNLE